METRSKHFRKRDAILACIRSTTCHPDAEWVYNNVREQIPDISLATVYRNLSLFKEQGKIISLGTVNGVERFDGNVEAHVHFICTGCGKVEDLKQLQVPQELKAAAGRETGGLVSACQLSFTGLCKDCMKIN